MSTLVLAPAERPVQPWAVRSLRTWLSGRWAIFFSHPDDFLPHDWEVDRWLVVLRHAFSKSGVRPLALGSDSLDGAQSWVGVVNSDAAPLVLEDRPGRASSMDLGSLGQEIHSAGSPFVMIIDRRLTVRRTFQYRVPANISPLDFLGWTNALREKSSHLTCGCACDRVTRGAASLVNCEL